MADMLTIDGVEVSYGAIRALQGISLTIKAGEIVTLIGANGAGKSTTLRAISGLVPAQRGRIVFEGAEIASLSADKIVQKGIGHPGRLRPRADPVSTPEGAHRPERRDALRRRAADAGDGPGAHGPPQAAAAG